MQIFYVLLNMSLLILHKKVSGYCEIGRKIEQGCARGEYIKLISLIRKKIAKNLTAEECADLLEEKLELIQIIYQLIEAHPDKNDTQIYEEYEKIK